MLWKRLLFVFMGVFIISVLVNAQDRDEFEWEELSTGGLIPDDPSASILVVESTVPKLSFSSRKGIRTVQDPVKERDYYVVVLDPGVDYVSIIKQGYLTLELPRHNYEPKGVWRIKVRTKPRFGAIEGFDSDRPRVRLDFEAGKKEEVYIQIDNTPPQKIDFSSGFIVLRPTTGQHLIKVYAGDRVWEKTMSLELGKEYTEQVSPSNDSASDLQVGYTGNLFIESDPPAARILLNGIEQQGTTPLSLNDLQPGVYTIEIVKDLYLPETRTVEVQELDYAKVDAKLAPNYGHLSIDSDPEGAFVSINGQQRGMTPLDVTRFPAGTYNLLLVKQMYHEVTDTIHLEATGNYEHTYALGPQFGSLTVTSTPPGAEIQVDGVNWGKTPTSKDQVLSGQHTVHVSLSNFFSQERNIVIIDGQSQSEPFLLSPSVGFLSVESFPSGAEVVIADSALNLGKTPIKHIPLNPGSYTLQLSYLDYEVFEQTVPVTLAGTPSVSAKLLRKAGHIRVSSMPSNAAIFLDGEQVGETPYIIRDVPTGTHSVRFEKTGYDTEVATVSVKHKQMLDFNISLRTEGTEAWKLAKARSHVLALVPGFGQMITPSQRFRGLLYLGGFLATINFAYDQNTGYNYAQTDYDTAMEDYHSAITQTALDEAFARAITAREDMARARDQRNILLIAAGSIYVIQYVDALIYGGGKLPTRHAQVASSKTQVFPFAKKQANGASTYGISVTF
ncbi:MAG: PEGA domain-containing protein [bacterium]